MKIILKINPQTKLIEDIAESYTTIPTSYTEYTLTSYPNDLMCGCYRYTNGVFVKDNALYSEFLKSQNEII